MKIFLERDFILYISGYEATLILRNCEKNCTFCSAVNLPNFQDHIKLQHIYKYGCTSLHIVGSANSSYLQSFVLGALRKNPDLKIRVTACFCNLKQIDVDYTKVIHPMLEDLDGTMPNRLFVPAFGSYDSLMSLVQEYAETYVGLPIKVGYSDASNSDVDFWSENKILELYEELSAKGLENLE